MPKLLESKSVRVGDPVHFTLTMEQRDAICLRCALTDCVGLESKECPVRVEQRRVWREKDARRKAAKSKQKDKFNETTQ